jgi:hypothetical protein
MKTAIEKKLHELGNGLFAYTQLPGSWGWSNSGLICDGDQSLLVDTERLYINVHTLYRDFSGMSEPADVLALFAGMARVETKRKLSRHP